MQIFTQEINDGLADKIANSNSLAFELIPSIIDNIYPPAKADERLSTNENIDLLYFNSVLASVGWNKNDDVFASAELWQARNTPVNKKINYMHDEKDIIGHMTNSNVIDFNGKFVPNDEIDTPDAFDVVVGGYIYKYWQDEKLRERMVEILGKVNSRELAVSMECMFPNFDYAIVTPDGQHKIIARAGDTAFLTKHLRIYGGTGNYEGFRIGRLLRNMVFTGNALVDRPANPRSLILKAESMVFSGALASISILQPKVEKTIMAEITKEQYDIVVKKLESAEAAVKDVVNKEIDSLKDINTKLTANAKEQIEAITKLKNELNASKEVSKAHEDGSAKLSDKIKLLEAELAQAKSELDKNNKEMCKGKRKAALAGVDIDEAKANELVERFANASDELFDELVKALPKKQVADTTTSAREFLDKAQDKDTNINIPSDIQNNLVAKASEWFASSLSKNDKGE